MKFHDLIFSDQRSYRMKRHIIFWIAWCFYFIITFLVPTYWVPGWDFKGPFPQIEKYGVGVSVLRILMNGILMTVVHMALVYGIIYYFLPKFLSKNTSKIVLTFFLFVFIIAIACFNYLNFLMTFSISTRMGYFTKMPDMNFIIAIWFRQIVFNYPTVVGIALAIKLTKRWYVKQKETEQVAKEKINAELQLLKSQVHPHFLFNTLNNIYSFILSGSENAPGMIKKLSSLLNYILYDCNNRLVPLDKELSLIQDYIALEQIRYGDRLNLNLILQGSPKGKMISPLLLIPFVENSFKHGTSRMLAHPWVRLDMIIDENFLELKLSNNKPQGNGEPVNKKGIGLNNVKKRLQLLYPETHSLSIIENDMSYDVFLKIALDTSDDIIEGQRTYSERIYGLA
jgi:two-component system LytT family sensor kinase